MAVNRFQEMQALFEQVQDLPAQEQSDWLKQNCDDEELRNEVAQLLRNDARSTDPLEAGVAAVETDIRRRVSAAPLARHAANPPSINASRSLAGETAGLGIHFGDYELNHEIARGGMGVVYQARQVSLERDVALKMIANGALANDEQVERFRTEARAAAKLDHPGIVPVYEVGESGGQHFYSMALVSGESLHERVQREGPLPPKEAAVVLKATAEAVHFGHVSGIIHRDVKPQNILLDGDDAPRITDFGLAKHNGSELTADGQLLGTPSYMPPEQAEAKHHRIGVQSDVYSLGATLYYVLTGRPPFQAASTPETLRQVVETEPVPPRRLNPAIPRDLETICLKCLRKNPASRYSDAEALADDLGRWIDRKPILARRVSTIEKTVLWCRRRPVVVGLMTAVVVIVAVSAFLGARQRRIASDRNNQTQARELVSGLMKAEIQQVPVLVDDIEEIHAWADPILEQELREAKDGSPEKLRLSLALLPRDSSQVLYLQSQLLAVDPSAISVIRAALRPHKGQITTTYWRVVKNTKNSQTSRLNAACLLAEFDPVNQQGWLPVLPFVAKTLASTLAKSPRDYAPLVSLLHPIRNELSPHLAAIVREKTTIESIREMALSLALEYSLDDPNQLTEILSYSTKLQFAKTFEKLSPLLDEAVPVLKKVIREKWSDSSPVSEKERIAKRQANAAVALLKLGSTKAVWPILKHAPDPRTRSYVIDWAAKLDVDPQVFIRRFSVEQDASIRRALLLALGGFQRKRLTASSRDRFVEQLSHVYSSDPDPGTHGCVEWLLKRWGYDDRLQMMNARLQKTAREPVPGKKLKRRWYMTPSGKKMAILEAGTFWMGPQKHEQTGDGANIWHLSHVDRVFAIATHEVTNKDFAAFEREYLHHEDYSWKKRYSRTSDSPRLVVSWFVAAAFCNWLSKREGIPEEEWCYEPNLQGQYKRGMKPKDNFLQLKGYRLPTDAEWEFACRAGVQTSRYYGDALELLPEYARFDQNSENHSWPVGQLKPNAFGLFDMLGNATEWCHNGSYSYSIVNANRLLRENVDTSPVSDGNTRVLRGGDFASSQLMSRSWQRWWGRPHVRVYTNGFRIAKTIRSHSRFPLVLRQFPTYRQRMNRIRSMLKLANDPKLVDSHRMLVRLEARRLFVEEVDKQMMELEGAPETAHLRRRRLASWLKAPEFANVRDAKELSKLPTEERLAWKKLWLELPIYMRYRAISVGGKTAVSDEQIESALKANREYIIVYCSIWNASKITNAGVEKLKRLELLRALRIQSAPNLTDDIFPTLARLKMLREIELHGTKVTGSSIHNLTRLPRLQSLTIARSPFEGKQIAFLHDIAEQLRSLNFYGARITDMDVPALLRFRRLKTLGLSVTKISDRGLLQITENLRVLRQLNVARNRRITDRGLRNVGQLRSLTRLGLAFTSIGDAATTEIAKLPNLESLSLRGTKITDASIQNLAKLKKLTALDIQNTAISKVAAERLKKSLPSCKVSWSMSKRAPKQE